MQRRVYDSQEWRELPRDGECVVAFLFGEAAGPCRGHITRHHVDPEDEHSRSFQVCIKHHNKVQTSLRKLLNPPRWKRCPHKPGTHRYAGAKEACERMLNRDLLQELDAA